MSVLIPAYDQGPLLRQAVESALAQTYRPLEVIVVDDGSPSPAPREVARAFGGRITYVEQSNTGVAGARQTALDRARGDLVALLDQDDLWLPHKLEVQLRALASHPNAVLSHSSCSVSDTAGSDAFRVELDEGEWQPLPTLLFKLPATLTCVFRRDAALAAGGFDQRLSGADDWDLFLRIALHGGTFHATAEPLAVVRRHRRNASLDVDLMAHALVGTLDKLYARDDLPQAVVDAKPDAYAFWRGHVASLYYARERHADAARHVLALGQSRPSAATFVRLVNGLAQARGKPAPPGAVAAAATFVEGVLAAGELRRPERQRLTAAARLGGAFYDGRARTPAVAATALRMLAHEPSLLLRRSTWRAAARR